MGHRALVVHGTFLGTEEIERLRVDRERLFLIWCPRSNAFFHPGTRHPVDAMLAAGASIAMGTDSRASSPNLNLWNELRFAMEQQPEISPKSLLRMATLNGARALGIENRYGSLEAGKSAHLAAVSLPRNISSDDENEACRKLLGCRQIGPLEALLAELETG
jgi:cytosine/adenosine deaminase-related metal-dependent hydrolase